MTTREDLAKISDQEIEEIERVTLRWMFQATMDFGFDAYEVFQQSPDDVKDVAEDITREILDRLSGYNISQRIFGTVDYKKARYIILPDQTVRQALFLDSKAEKSNSTATMQMSQTSMAVRQRRGGEIVDHQGSLPSIYKHGNTHFLTTTALIHYKYADRDGIHILNEATLTIVPNGKLQNIYNPTVDDTIWRAGRNAPSLGEDFRVRLRFSAIAEKSPWRVQKVKYNAHTNTCAGKWQQ